LHSCLRLWRTTFIATVIPFRFTLTLGRRWRLTLTGGSSGCSGGRGIGAVVIIVIVVIVAIVAIVVIVVIVVFLRRCKSTKDLTTDHRHNLTADILHIPLRVHVCVSAAGLLLLLLLLLH